MQALLSLGVARTCLPVAGNGGLLVSGRPLVLRWSDGIPVEYRGPGFLSRLMLHQSLKREGISHVVLFAEEAPNLRMMCQADSPLVLIFV